MVIVVIPSIEGCDRAGLKVAAFARPASALCLGGNSIIIDELLRSSPETYIVITMTPTQSKMARAALGWSLTDLAKNAGVGRDAAARFELGEKARLPVSGETRDKLAKAFTDAGAQFSRRSGRVGVTVPE